MSQGHELSMINAGAEAATTGLPVRTALQAVFVSPAHKRLLATRELVKAAREDAFPVTLEVRCYFGVVSKSVLRLYGRLLAAEVLTFHELAAAAGDGPLLTTTVRSVVADAPEIITSYDIGQHKRAKSYKAAWELWDDASPSALPGAGGVPAVKFTELAKQRARDADHRTSEYFRLHPSGDPRFHACWEETQWKLAEMKILSP
jgi:hypothetical protein